MGALQGSSAEDIYTLAVNQRSFDPCLREFIGRHERLFVLTGAGCSTDSGIPDYRDAEGAWKRAQPVNYRAFMADELTRRRYWARSMVGWPRFGRARPNAAHHALACLERSGRITRLVTQNVDGLHQAAGCKTVIDLHGRLDGVLCVRCELRTRRAALQRQLLRRNPEWHGLRAALGPDGDADLERLDFSAFDVPACERCGGILKPDVVFFGESVPQDRVRAAMNALEQADAVLIVGSSLMVYSGYRFAQRAFQAGKPVASVNLGRTRADDLIELKVPQACASALAFLLREELPTSAAAAAVD